MRKDSLWHVGTVAMQSGLELLYWSEMVHFQGNTLSDFHFCLSSQWESTLKGKNLFLHEQIPYFKSRSHLKGAGALKSRKEIRQSVVFPFAKMVWKHDSAYTVKILKIGTPEIITIIVLQLEQLDFTVQYCVQKMQTE